MRFTIQAACGCHTGRKRSNNEDNVYFEGRCLERNHNGLKNPVYFEDTLKNGLCLAVFDGMGGEHYGEYASYAAARQMQQLQQVLEGFFISEKQYLERMVCQLNDAVIQVQQEMSTERIGTTMVSLYFSGRYVYCCNIGDSRAYRLRGGEFLQLSQDHAESTPGEKSASCLTQYLGSLCDAATLAPHIAKGQLQQGDLYLLCSDGLTDMLPNFEICDILLRCQDPELCVTELIRTALERGGYDNISAIVCKIS